MGVPNMWLDDAVQDIAVRVWRSNDDGVTIVRNAAIDAVRKYGPRSRKGVQRVTVPWPEDYDLADDPLILPPPFDPRLAELNRALQRLPETWRDALVRWLAGVAAKDNGRHGETREYQLRKQALRRLRTELR